MNTGRFKEVAAFEGNPAWETLIRRENELYEREGEIRSQFARDYTRVLHSMAYRRLKHKTQVFINIDNDHVCTRMEHVSHVESVSSSIAKVLGLNDELTKAISIGHDLGHAPFGHQGERIIDALSQKYLKKRFWHEQNGLRFVDKIELLEDNYKNNRNLDLTYAVRDGIISHCGEVDHNGLKPRDSSIPLDDFTEPGEYEAVTWEGCVVKMADKIAYVGRDIEDAVTLGILSDRNQEELLRMARLYDQNVLNTTVIMHNMIIDICQNSDPDDGIRLSPVLNDQLQEIKRFNYEHIYDHPRLGPHKKYSELVLNQLFDTLLSLYDGDAGHLWDSIDSSRRYAPTLISFFEKWLAKYCDARIVPSRLQSDSKSYTNTKIYGMLDTQEICVQAIIDFISGMTDRFAISVFNELLDFGFHN